jgi:hypothetical protein
MRQCKCSKCNFENQDDESKEIFEPRKKSLRIREAKQTAKGKVYFDSLKRKHMKVKKRGPGRPRLKFTKTKGKPEQY